MSNLTDPEQNRLYNEAYEAYLLSRQPEPPLIEPEFDENGHPVWPS
jgi:hypothetical protein